MRTLLVFVLLLPRLLWWAITGNWAPLRLIWHQAKKQRADRKRAMRR